MLKFAFPALALAAALVAAAPALAQDEPEPEAPLGAASGGIDVTASLELMTDYRFRGISRSDEDPAGQATLNLFHGSGLYAGARGTTLKGADTLRLTDPALGDLGDVQLDLYLGYGRSLGGGFEMDAGALYYVFAGGDGPTDYVEPYASLSYLIGPVYATAGAKYAPAQDAIGDEDMLYLFGQVDVAIPFRPWSFTASVGHQDWGGHPDHWNWSLGAEHRVRLDGLGAAHLGLRYFDTDLPAVAGQDAGLALYARLSF
jgi:uncharacterized protein (TIGR02001 family)